MTEFKRRTLILNSGKQIKLFGNSIAIGKSLQIGEGYAPNIFSCIEQQQEVKPATDANKVSQETKPTGEQPQKKTIFNMINPYHLTEADIFEIADYNIRLWLDLKDNIRRHGVNSPKVFNRDTLL
ncbi:MAG: hypothetical protein J0H29_09705 [Sphingobacteriales bacterium]|nr:hypothetical protein [Sphingobacteriales bacterium]OJY90097.1 MAG: hypothetical protein BGP14_10350 [Sphingobacteriales bacterium 44-15]